MAKGWQWWPGDQPAFLGEGPSPCLWGLPSTAQLPPLRNRSVERGAWWPLILERCLRKVSQREDMSQASC